MSLLSISEILTIQYNNTIVLSVLKKINVKNSVSALNPDWMLKMSFLCHLSTVVNDALSQVIPDVNQTLLQLIDVS